MPPTSEASSGPAHPAGRWPRPVPAAAAAPAPQRTQGRSEPALRLAKGTRETASRRRRRDFPAACTGGPCVRPPALSPCLFSELGALPPQRASAGRRQRSTKGRLRPERTSRTPSPRPPPPQPGRGPGPSEGNLPVGRRPETPSLTPTEEPLARLSGSKAVVSLNHNKRCPWDASSTKLSADPRARRRTGERSPSSAAPRSPGRGSRWPRPAREAAPRAGAQRWTRSRRTRPRPDSAPR